MHLETSRLILRDLEPSDVEPLARLWSDPEATRFMGGPRDHAWLLQVFGEDAQREQETYDLRPVCDKINGEVVGHCGLLEKDVDGAQEVELVYVLAPSHWGQGLATEAATALRDFALRDLGLTRLICLIHPENQASERVALKVGMRMEREIDRPGGGRRRVYALTVSKGAGEAPALSA